MKKKWWVNFAYLKYLGPEMSSKINWTVNLVCDFFLFGQFGP